MVEKKKVGKKDLEKGFDDWEKMLVE